MKRNGFKRFNINSQLIVQAAKNNTPEVVIYRITEINTKRYDTCRKSGYQVSLQGLG